MQVVEIYRCMRPLRTFVAFHKNASHAKRRQPKLSIYLAKLTPSKYLACQQYIQQYSSSIYIQQLSLVVASKSTMRSWLEPEVISPLFEEFHHLKKILKIAQGLIIANLLNDSDLMDWPLLNHHQHSWKKKKPQS